LCHGKREMTEVLVAFADESEPRQDKFPGTYIILS